MVATSLALLSIIIAGPSRIQALEPQLSAICKGFHGDIGYCLLDLKSRERIEFQGAKRFPTASTIKVALLVEAVNQVEEGKLKWSDQRKLPPSKDRTENMSSMWSYFMKDGTKVNLDGLCNLMITYSDNFATHIVGKWVTNQAVKDRMERLGLNDTAYLAYPPKDGSYYFRLWNKRFGLGMTTPLDMSKLFEKTYDKKATSTEAGSERILRILSRQYWDDYIGGSVPPGTVCATKTGAISRSRSDCAIVFGDNPYVLTIYTDNQKDQRWTADNEGELAIKKIAGLVWNSMNPHKKYSPPAGADKFAPTGGGVE